MVAMANPKKKPAAKRQRNVLFISLDNETEAALQRFLAAQRVAPDRAAVGLTALHEFLKREGYAPEYAPAK